MSFFDSLHASASGLTAQRLRMDIIANNLANANSTRSKDGGAYRRQLAVFESREAQQRDIDGRTRGTPLGVRVARIIEDESPLRLVHDPDHPDANADGYVAYPNVNTVQEMTDMISATRSYEANVTVINAVKGMAGKALEI
ncbi:MAG: flagellar basal body rod protein FlgC [Candidatus Sericytochromatia bacterium]|nr:flagellar basal body rod protein FlgC [Candidatus Sericytochromatia bacterium]